MIIQGSNLPLTVEFDKDVDTMPKLVITLWRTTMRNNEAPLKKWELTDMTVEGNVAVCPFTEAETKALPDETLTVEAKGLDDNGNTVFWARHNIDVLERRDRVITLIQEG